MFIRRLSKLFICVTLIFLFFENNNAYYLKKGSAPYYIQIMRPILKREHQLGSTPSDEGKGSYIPANPPKECPSNSDCNQGESKKVESTIFKRKNQIDECRVNDDDCQEYLYDTNQRPVKVDGLDKKILEVLLNMELETDIYQEMYDQRFRN